MKKILILLCIPFLLQSCGTTHLLQKGYEGKKYYEIKRLNGCCGCTAFYFNIYENKKLQTQFVHEVSCGFGLPTRFSFSNGSKETYVFVTDSTYEIPLNALEKKLLFKLDSILPLTQTAVRDTVKYSAITGSRKPKDLETTHPFQVKK